MWISLCLQMNRVDWKGLICAAINLKRAGACQVHKGQRRLSLSNPKRKLRGCYFSFVWLLVVFVLYLQWIFARARGILTLFENGRWNDSECAYNYSRVIWHTLSMMCLALDDGVYGQHASPPRVIGCQLGFGAFWVVHVSEFIWDYSTGLPY
jgi:hypothetical protein